MTIIFHKIARPVKGSEIAIHALLSPLMAAFVAIIISPSKCACYHLYLWYFWMHSWHRYTEYEKNPWSWDSISFYWGSWNIWCDISNRNNISTAGI